jgi:hypothetical protein
MQSAQSEAAIVIAYEDRIAAELLESAIFDGAILGPLEEDGPTAIDRPVAPQQRFLRVHERARAVAKHKPFQTQMLDRIILVAAELDQGAVLHGLDHGYFQIDVLGGPKVKRAILGVEEPLTWSVEFLEDVLDEAYLVVHAEAAIVLPTAFEGDGARRVLAGDCIVEIAPQMFVHRMDEAAARVGPTCRAFLAERIGSTAAKVLGLGVEVRVPRQVHAPAVDEKLVSYKSFGNTGLEDSVLERCPIQLQKAAAADDDLSPRRGLVDDRRRGRP